MAEHTDKHGIGPDGLRQDGVGTYPADAHDMQLVDEAKAQLAQHTAPLLVRSTDPHTRLFVAAFDGTGNDADGDPDHITNIGRIRDQLKAVQERGNGSIEYGYVAGPGTQEKWLPRTIDGAQGYTYEARIEEMYDKLSRQAAQWLREDPNARISVADIGFSRGAEQAAGFARLLHERGIVDPDSKVIEKDANGHDVVRYTRNLVEPGQTPQVAVLMDPVGTGKPMDYDRRLPPSVIGGLQITSEDERRSLFKVSQHMDPGSSQDGRFLNVWMPGAHSDQGGGYHRNGLSMRSGNLAIDYLNSLSDRPYLDKNPESTDPRMNVVHRSEEGMLIYRLTREVDRRTPAGTVETLAPASVCRVVDTCRDAEPVDAALAARFERRPVTIGPVPASPDPATPALSPDIRVAPARSALDDQFERLGNAAIHRDIDAAKQVGRDYLQSGEGQALQQQGRDGADATRALDQQTARDAQQALVAQQASQANVETSRPMHR